MRRGERWLRACAATVAALALALSSLAVPRAALAGPAPPTESITLTLAAPAYRLERAPDGSPALEAPGFSAGALPGEYPLPRRIIELALPPDADPASLRLEMADVMWSAPLPGVWRLRRAGPDQPSCAGGAAARNPHPLAPARAVPTQPATAPVRLLGSAQLGPWRLARLEFRPFRFDPASGRLSALERGTLELHYARLPAALAAGPAAARFAARYAAQAAARCANFDQARAWYEPAEDERAAGASTDYVIITTNAIVAASSRLAPFVAHKQAQGHSVRVVTESDYGGLTGPPPNGRAEKVRRWLMDHYAADGVEFVLLIGNPTPDGSGPTALPMKRVWPRRGATSDQDSVTDYFFADLTGDWDLDGDTYYGEWSDYALPGGVDLVAEVAVGRIPYYGDPAALDAILQKTMDYESAPGAPSQLSALFPVGFQASGYDGAPLAEQIWNDYLASAGFSRWRQYQQGSSACAANSAYPSEQELRGGTLVRDRWAAGRYGLVVWWGHGNESSTQVGYESCWDGTLLDSAQTAVFDGSQRAFVYQNSCSNGYPEDPGNLGYALLRRGAVATVSASRVSWFNTGEGYGDFDGSTTNAGIGYEIVKRLAAGMPVGQALYAAKGSLAPDRPTRLMNAYDFNLYGEPTLTLPVVLRNVEIAGPRVVWMNKPRVFAATPVPANASKPITYTWSGGQLGPTVSLSWTVTGTVTVAVTATGPVGQASQSIQVIVLGTPAAVLHLPVVARE